MRSTNRAEYAGKVRRRSMLASRQRPRPHHRPNCCRLAIVPDWKKLSFGDLQAVFYI